MTDQSANLLALDLARAAIKNQLGHALTPILDALATIVSSGTAAQFYEVEQLLERELHASHQDALVVRPLLAALHTAEARGERWMVACIERRLGWTYDRSGDDVAALEMGQRAGENFEALGDDEGAVRALSNLGVLWARRGDNAESARMFEKALTRADRMQILPERIRVRANFGYVCGLLSDYGRARYLLNEALALSASIKGSWMLISTIINLSRIELAEGNLDRAEAVLIRAEQQMKVGGIQHGEIEVSLVRGQIATRQGRHADALMSFSSGIALAQKTGAPRDEKELWDAVSECHRETENYQGAFEAMQRAAALDEQLRKERAMLQTAIASERRAAERAQHEVERARVREQALRESFDVLQKTQSELRRSNEKKDLLVVELHRQSREDSLTSLLNRRALDTELATAALRADPATRPLAVILLDVDNFKRINDEYSHAVGDAVLVAIASQLLRTRRKTDIVARLGGEELVIALPDTSLEAAIEFCTRLRAALASFNWTAEGINRPVTVSMGLVLMAAGESAHAVLARADVAMYRAKAEGKDRVCWDK